MNHDPESVGATRAGSGESGAAQVKHLLIISALTIVLTGCGFPAGRDVRAYDTCMSLHPQEAALCEGPRRHTRSTPRRFRQKQRKSARRLAAVTTSEQPRPILRWRPCHSVPT